jgi:Zn-finger nucleic acid-binding protein
MKKTTKKEAESHGEAFLQCPRCAVRMKKLKNNETIIDVCESCGGLWLDAGEIDKLASLHPRNR